MRALLEFAMRSRLAAVALVALGALVPLLFWLSAGLLALITLRRGLAESALVLAGATAALAPVYAVMLGTPLAVLQPLALVWLPVMGLAQVLRVRVSLETTIQVGALVAAGAVIAFYGLYGDPSVFWRQILEMLSQQLIAGPPGEGWNQTVDQLAPRLTGLWVTNVLAIALLCLLLGRWWQAMLYNPSGFRREFHALQLSPWFAAIAAAAVIAGLFSAPGLVADLGTILGAVFILQAVAVAHAVVARRGWHIGWLVGFYLVLPVMLRPAMVIGLADPAINFRARLAPET
jgi:hypothetical protein